MPRSLMYATLAAAVAGSASACDGQGGEVPVDPNDTSPPVVAVLETAGRKGGELRVTPSSGAQSGTLAPDESMLVAARADDPQGVRRVSIFGESRHTCIDSNGLATSGGPGLSAGPIADSVDQATPGGTTTDQRAVTYSVRTADFTCPSGSQLALELSFWATAENHGGGTAQSQRLTLNLNPP